MKFKQFLFMTLTLGVCSVTQAVPYSEAVESEMLLQGGSQSTNEWTVPVPGMAQVFVFVPKGSTAIAATYQIYPEGNSNNSTYCSSIDVISPCFEAAINQKTNQGKLVQLKSKDSKSWKFSKAGFVSIVASKSAAKEFVGIATARFVQVPYRQKFSKISNTGAALPNTATLGTAESDWGCTQDDNTGLIWEIKTADKGLRDQDNQYSWYDPNPETNGGYSGLQNGGATLCTGDISCDTNGYVEAVNKEKLCGFSDWRMPTYRELVGLIKPGLFPSIDLNYFPNTADFRTWSSTTDLSYNTNAWFVYLGNGSASSSKDGAFTMRTRLVRNGLLIR